MVKVYSVTFFGLVATQVATFWHFTKPKNNFRVKHFSVFSRLFFSATMSIVLVIAQCTQHTAMHISDSVIFNQFIFVFLMSVSAAVIHRWTVYFERCVVFNLLIQNETKPIDRIFFSTWFQLTRQMTKFRHNGCAVVFSSCFVCLVCNESLFQTHANIELWCRKENIAVRATRSIGVRCCVSQLTVVFSLVFVDSFLGR